MERKPSSLTGPLWVVGIGLVILGMGVGFMAYVLWEKREEANRPPSKAPPTPEELRAMVYSNRTLPLASNPVRREPTMVNVVKKLPPGSTSTTPQAPQTDASAIAEAVQPTTPALPTGAGGGGGSIQTGSFITGHITLRGTPPAEIPITVTDPNCGKVAPPPTKTRFYVVGKDSGLADVFVYVRAGLEGRVFRPNLQTRLIDQRGCEYTPQVLGVQTRRSVVVRNSDQTLHNVHFTPAVEGNKEINKAQMGGGADLKFTWPKPEVFLRLKCDVHPWMFSYLGVLDHPFFSVSDTNGVFTLSGVPPGRYVLEAVHRKTHGRGGNGLQREIEVKAGENLQVDFEVEAPR